MILPNGYCTMELVMSFPPRPWWPAPCPSRWCRWWSRPWSGTGRAALVRKQCSGPAGRSRRFRGCSFCVSRREDFVAVGRVEFQPLLHRFHHRAWRDRGPGKLVEHPAVLLYTPFFRATVSASDWPLKSSIHFALAISILSPRPGVSMLDDACAEQGAAGIDADQHHDVAGVAARGASGTRRRAGPCALRER